MKAWRPSGALRRKWAVWGCGVPVGFVLVPALSYLLYCNQPLPAPPTPPPLPRPNGFEGAFEALGRLTPLPDGSPLERRDFRDAKILREKLAQEKDGLERLRRSLRLEWGVPPVQDITQTFPYLAQFRDAARMFAAESRLALAEGRGGAAVERALDAVDLGSRLGQSAPLAHAMAGLSCAAIGADQAGRTVSSLSGPEARRAGERLDEIRSRFPRAGETLEQERRLTLATIQKIFRNELDVRRLSGAAPRARDRGAPPWFLYPKPWSYRSMDRAFRRYIAEAAKSPVERRPVELPRDILTRLMLEPLAEITPRFDRHETALRLLRLELALREHQQTRGKYPERLSVLETALGAAELSDPFSGRSLIYRREGDGYLLYSVGPDGKDDGGVPQKPGSSAGGDIVAGALDPLPGSR